MALSLAGKGLLVARSHAGSFMELKARSVWVVFKGGTEQDLQKKLVHSKKMNFNAVSSLLKSMVYNKSFLQHSICINCHIPIITQQLKFTIEPSTGFAHANGVVCSHYYNINICWEGVAYHTCCL